MATYKYNLDELQQTASGLSTIASDFEGASSTREGYDGAMGYDKLRDAVHEFTQNWKHNREKQLEAINGASQMLNDICTNYRDFDRGATEQLYEGQ